MKAFPFVPMEVVERSQYDGGTYFLIQTEDDRNGWEVAEVRTDIPWQIKTAQLLAAAPDLLEALEAAVSHHDDFFKSSNGHAELPWAAPARIAIAKAKGEQP